jgi:hypothetical protein
MDSKLAPCTLHRSVDHDDPFYKVQVIYQADYVVVE